MIVDASCALTSRSIRLAVGSSSSCARHFPFEASHKYLIFDRDQEFGFKVIAAVKATRMNPI
jgi:urease beta subunit